MRRMGWLMLALLLIGCTALPGETAQPTPAIVEITVDEPISARTEPVAAPDASAEPTDAPAGIVPTALLPTVWVEDGAAYGCDVVCYADGFGFGYDLEGWKANECRIYVEEQPIDDLPPHETHRLMLAVGGETFCLGELRYNTERLMEPNLYGLSYEWIVTDSDLVELEPATVQTGRAQRTDTLAFVSSFDRAAGTLDILTAKILDTGPDAPLEFDSDSISEKPITLRVPEGAALSILNDESREMLITFDRFFTLLEQGYIGFLPAAGEDMFVGCGVGYDGDTLLYLYEIGDSL